LVTAAGVAED